MILLCRFSSVYLWNPHLYQLMANETNNLFCLFMFTQIYLPYLLHFATLVICICHLDRQQLKHNQDAIGKDEHFKMLPMCPAKKLKELLPFPGEKTTRWSWEFGPTGKLFPPHSHNRIRGF